MGGRGASGPRGDTRSRSLAYVGRLASGNEPGLTVAQEYHRKEVLGHYSPNDYEVARGAGFASPKAYQEYITEHIRQHGQINPAQYSNGALDEGYHRYAAAKKLKHRTMKVRETD